MCISDVSTEVNECVKEPCLNGGTCHDLPHGYFCSCPDTVLGDLCDIFIDIQPEEDNTNVMMIVIIMIVVAIIIIATVIISVFVCQRRDQKVPDVMGNAVENEGLGHSGASLWYPSYTEKMPGHHGPNGPHESKIYIT